MKPEHIEDYREVETATGANASTSRSGGDRMKNVNFPYVRAASSVATVPQPALNEVIAHSKDQMKSTRKRAAMDMNKIEKAARPDQLVKKQCLGVRDHLALVETTPSTQGGAQIANPEKLGDKQSSSTEVREAEKDVHAGGRSQNKVELDVIVVSGSTPQADEKVSSETQQSKWSAGGECNGEGGENFKLNPEEVKKALSDFYLFDEDLKKFSCSECARFEANEAKMKRHVRIYHASMISVRQVQHGFAKAPQRMAILTDLFSWCICVSRNRIFSIARYAGGFSMVMHL